MYLTRLYTKQLKGLLVLRLCSTSSYASKSKVLYDGDCPLCMKEITVLQRINRKKNVLEFVDLTKPGYEPAQNGDISLDQALEVMHVIGRDGTVHQRLDAVRHMYAEVGLGWLWRWTTWPLVGPRADELYLWFARNRLWLTGKQHDSCDSGQCEAKFKSKRR